MFNINNNQNKIQHLGGKISNTSRIELEQYLENDPNKKNILSVFDAINNGKIENNISHNNWVKSLCGIDRNDDNKLTDFEIQTWLNSHESTFKGITFDNFKNFLSSMSEAQNHKENLNTEKEITNLMKEKGFTRDFINKVGIYESSNLKQVSQNNKTYYEFKVDVDDEIIYKKYDLNGNLIEKGSQNTQYVDENGEIYTTNESEKYENGQVTYTNKNNNTGVIEMTRVKDNGHTEYITQKGNVTFKETVIKTDSGTHDPTEQIETTRLDAIQLNNGMNKVNIKLNYDQNSKLSGLKIDTPQKPKRVDVSDGMYYFKESPATMEPKTFETIKNLIDNGAKFDKDFNLEVKNGKVIMKPKIINNSSEEIPDLKGEALEKFKNLIKSGVHTGDDFDIEYNQDKTFKIKYKNNQSSGYNTLFKEDTYDKNGKLLSSVEVKDNKIFFKNVKNGITKETSENLDEYLLKQALDNNFDKISKLIGNKDITIGGYNLYKLADLYKEKTGRDFVIDLKHSNSKLKNNLFAHLHIGNNKDDATTLKDYQKMRDYYKDVLYDTNLTSTPASNLVSTTKRTNTSNNTHTETIDGIDYKVSLNGNNINISKNNNHTVSIDVSKLPKEFVNNILMNTNNLVLYDIGLSNIELVLDENINSHNDELQGNINGFVSGNKLYLDPNTTTQNRMQLVLAHEAGHISDKIDDLENTKDFLNNYYQKQNFSNDHKITLSEFKAELGTNHPTSVSNKKLKATFDKELKAYKEKNIHMENISNEYALTNILEFFAESYSFLTIGDCKSKYILSKYFPESLKLVKEQIEKNRKFKENN